MNTTIHITPRTFGNIAAAAMSYGKDVTTLLLCHALAEQPNSDSPQRSIPAQEQAPRPVPAKTARAEEKKESDDKTAIMSLADKWCYADN